MQKNNSTVNSGVAWLGDIPSDWKLFRGKFLYRNEKVINKGLIEPQRLALTLNGVTARIDGDDVGLNPESLESYQIFNAGDLVFKLIDLENKKTSRVGLVPKRGIMSPAYIRLSPKNEVCAKYFYYYYYSLYLNYVFNNIAGEGVRANLSPRELLELPLIMPEPNTQERIANYLDEETKKIDILIAKQGHLLELLEEKRRATITHAITNGLKSNVEYKDTNINWLGRIPTSWEVKRVKNVARVVLGKMVQNDQKKSNEVKKPYLKSRNIQWDGLDLRDVDEMWFKPAEIESYKLLDDDIIVSEGGDVGKCVMWKKEFGEMYFQNSANRVRVTGANPKYIFYVFQHYALNQVFANTVNKVSIAHLTKDKIVAYHLPIPSKNEQDTIVEYLDEENEKFRNLKAKILEQINLLKERRVSLISNVVTGRVKV